MQRNMEAARDDAPASAPLRWADMAEMNDDDAVESTARPNANVHEQSHEFDRASQLPGAPEAFQAVSEQSANAVGNVSKRGARAQDASHRPTEPWREARHRRQRFGASSSRKPAHFSTFGPAGCDQDATNRLHRSQTRHHASHSPLGPRGTASARTSTTKPAKTRIQTDAAPLRTTSNLPAAMSASTVAAAMRAATAAGARAAATRTWAHVAAAPPPPPPAQSPPPHAPPPPAPNAYSTLPTLPAGLLAELAAIAARMASEHADLCVFLRTDGAMLFGTTLHDTMHAQWQGATTEPLPTPALPPGLPANSATPPLLQSSRARRDRLRMMLHCAALHAAHSPEHADATAAAAAAAVDTTVHRSTPFCNSLPGSA